MSGPRRRIVVIAGILVALAGAPAPAAAALTPHWRGVVIAEVRQDVSDINYTAHTTSTWRFELTEQGSIPSRSAGQADGGFVSTSLETRSLPLPCPNPLDGTYSAIDRRESGSGVPTTPSGRFEFTIAQQALGSHTWNIVGLTTGSIATTATTTYVGCRPGSPIASSTPVGGGSGTFTDTGDYTVINDTVTTTDVQIVMGRTTTTTRTLRVLLSRNSDTDGDGLTDEQELTSTPGTDPFDPDTDDDQLLDGAEAAHGTSPVDPDSDNDGYPDGAEVGAGTSPIDPTSYPGAPPPTPPQPPTPPDPGGGGDGGDGGGGGGGTCKAPENGEAIRILKVGHAVAEGCFTRRKGQRPYKANGSFWLAGLRVTPTSQVSIDGNDIVGQGDVRLGSWRIPAITAGMVPVHQKSWSFNSQKSILGKDWASLPLTGTASIAFAGASSNIELTVDFVGIAEKHGTLDAMMGTGGVAKPGGTLKLRAANREGADLVHAELRAGEITLVPRRGARRVAITLQNVLGRYEKLGESTRWTIGAEVALPDPSLWTPGRRIAGKLSIVDGQLGSVAGSIYNLNVVLGGPVFLQDAGLELSFRPTFFVELFGTASLGPRVIGDRSFAEGKATLRFGALTNCGLAQEGISNEVVGTVPIVTEFLPGEAKVTGKLCVAPGDGAASLRNDVSFLLLNGSVGFTGSLDGWVTVNGGSTFSVTGEGRIRIPAAPDLTGHAIMTSRGIAACGGVFGIETGWGYRWGDPLSGLEVFSGCDLAPWQATQAARRASAAGRVRRTAAVRVPPARAVLGIRVAGSGGVPTVVLKRPDGKPVPIDPAAPPPGMVVAPLAETSELVILVARPEPGDWLVEPAAGSVPVLEVRTTSELPEPKVTGRVEAAARGRHRLVYSIAPLAGQVVEFYEVGQGVARLVGRSGAARGSIAFASAAGSVAARRIEAVVLQDGLPRATLTVARFAGAQRVAPAAPGSVAATLRAGILRASWPRTAGARRWQVTVTPAGARPIELLVRAPRLRLQGLGTARSATVRVVAVGAGELRSGAVSRRVTAPR